MCYFLRQEMLLLRKFSYEITSEQLYDLRLSKYHLVYVQNMYLKVEVDIFINWSHFE